VGRSSRCGRGGGGVVDRIPLSQLVGLMTEELRQAARQASGRPEEVKITQFEECQLDIPSED
jgi:hypothetical protein